MCHIRYGTWQGSAEWFRIVRSLIFVVGQELTETVKTLAGLSRFVIADIGGPSVPQELYATVPHFKIPFAPIYRHDLRPYAMLADLIEYPWVLKPVAYQSSEQFIDLQLDTIICVAEDRLRERQAKLKELFES